MSEARIALALANAIEAAVREHRRTYPDPAYKAANIALGLLGEVCLEIDPRLAGIGNEETVRRLRAFATLERADLGAPADPLTHTDVRALVEAGVAREREEIAKMVEGSVYTVAGDRRALEPVDTARAGMDTHHATIAAAIRARGYTMSNDDVIRCGDAPEVSPEEITRWRDKLNARFGIGQGKLRSLDDLPAAPQPDPLAHPDVRALVEALRPFAEAADTALETTKTHTVGLLEAAAFYHLPGGSFMRARAALAKLKGGAG